MARHPYDGALDRYLLPGETLVVAQRRHWASVAEPVASGVVAVLVAGGVVGVAREVFDVDPWPLWWLALVPLARGGWRLAQWATTWFVATDKRLVLATGVVTRRVAMLPLGKVTDMSYARTLPGRLLGYGRFVLESAGQDQAMRRIDWVASPDETYRSICDTLFGVVAPQGTAGPRRSGGGRSAGGESEAVTGELPLVDRPGTVPPPPPSRGDAGRRVAQPGGPPPAPPVPPAPPTRNGVEPPPGLLGPREAPRSTSFARRSSSRRRRAPRGIAGDDETGGRSGV